MPHTQQQTQLLNSGSAVPPRVEMPAPIQQSVASSGTDRPRSERMKEFDAKLHEIYQGQINKLLPVLNEANQDFVRTVNNFYVESTRETKKEFEEQLKKGQEKLRLAENAQQNSRENLNIVKAGLKHQNEIIKELRENLVELQAQLLSNKKVISGLVSNKEMLVETQKKLHESEEIRINLREALLESSKRSQEMRESLQKENAALKVSITEKDEAIEQDQEMLLASMALEGKLSVEVGVLRTALTKQNEAFNKVQQQWDNVKQQLDTIRQLLPQSPRAVPETVSILPPLLNLSEVAPVQAQPMLAPLPCRVPITPRTLFGLNVLFDLRAKASAPLLSMTESYEPSEPVLSTSAEPDVLVEFDASVVSAPPADVIQAEPVQAIVWSKPASANKSQKRNVPKKSSAEKRVRRS